MEKYIKLISYMVIGVCLAVSMISIYGVIRFLDIIARALGV